MEEERKTLSVNLSTEGDIPRSSSYTELVVLSMDEEEDGQTKTPSAFSPPPAFIFNPFSLLKNKLTRYLATCNTAILTIFTVVVAFSAYFSIYGISVSLFAATFDGVKVFGVMELKVAFSIAQMLGYAVGKIGGIMVIPTLKRDQRCPALIALALAGEAPLVLFGCLPPAGQVVMVFLSGIPLAWLWGILVMYLEGRRTSEFLLMGLYLSVMVASGVAKSIAAAVLGAGVSESWMPASCGAVSAVIFIMFVILLDCIPDPSDADKKQKSERKAMTQQEARTFLIKWAPGLIVITLVYSTLTMYRNFRDYFAPEIWRDLLGPDFDPSKFTQSELPVGIITAAAYSLLYWIKKDKNAFFAILATMFFGGVVILGATILQTAGLISPLPWMICIGTGLFMAYIPPGAMLYDRFNGAVGLPYTSVFMIYLSDIFGYAATLTVLFYRNFGDANLPYLVFFRTLSYVGALACMGGMCVAAVYFIIAMRKLPDKGKEEEKLTSESENTPATSSESTQA